MKRELLKALLVTAELTGTELSEAAARVMLDDLAEYPADQVMGALKRCRLELRGRLTVAEVLARLDDGRPSADEAYAMLPQTEDQTVVWTDEMREAWAVALPLMRDGDRTGARLAFRAAYADRVAAARRNHIQPRWSVSPGTDPRQRATAIEQAVQRGQLPRSALNEVRYLIPPSDRQPRLAGIGQDARS